MDNWTWWQWIKVKGVSVANPLRIFPVQVSDRIRAALVRARGTLPKTLRVRRGEVALLVGTPNPSTMVRFSNAVGPSGLVVIVEPAPENIRRLEEAYDRLPWTNVQLVPCAAWSELDHVTFSLAAHSGDHKIDVDGVEHDNDYRPENTYEETITVQAQPLDNIVEQQELDRVDYVEIMVNGAELEVLRGATSLLRKHRPIRLLVKGHARTEEGKPLNEDICEFLDQFGITTIITEGGDPAVGTNPEWNVRDGDVWAYAN